MNTNQPLTPAQAEMMFDLDRRLTQLIEETLHVMDADDSVDDTIALAVLMSVLGRLAAQLALTYGVSERAYAQGMQMSYRAAAAALATHTALRRAAGQ